MDDNKTIGNYVSEDYRTATVFNELGIDFCCGGKKTLKEVCKEKNIKFDEVKRALEETKKDSALKDEASIYELDALADYIIKTHHTYVNKKLPEIEAFLVKLVKVHGKKHTELNKVHEIFLTVKEELLSHMMKEEHVLFPYIKGIAEAKRHKARLSPPPFGTIRNPIRMMEYEHESAGNAFHKIREITSNLIPPQDACTTYKVAFSMLNEFEVDLHRHIHLENNILFPKAIELEQKLLPNL